MKDEEIAQITERITKSSLNQEIGHGIAYIMSRLTGNLIGEIAILYSDDEGITEQSREFAMLSLKASAQNIRAFATEIAHMANAHGLQEVRDCIERWKRAIAKADEEENKIINGEVEP